MGRKSKTIVPLLVLFCLISLVLLPHVTVKAQTKTLTVPDQYPTIQDAIGNASAGDTIFVKKGTYNLPAQGLLINKSLSLIGEDNKEAILTSHNEYSGNNINRGSINIEASNVIISGFTITNGVWAIYPYNNNFNVKILSNIIVNNSAGILTDSSGLTDFFISDNNFSNNAIAIDGRISDSVISGNTISDNSGAITLSESVNVTLNGNNIFNNSFGLNLNGDSNSYIYGNNITANTRNYQYGNNAGFNSGFGILFAAGCNDIFVYENNIEGNIFGVYLVNSQLGVLPSFGSGNVVYRNNMVNNSQNVNVDQGLSYNVEGRVVNGTTAVSWDNGTIGNYWSDYQSKYPNATEIQSSGIGNEPYVINENNTDHYPLVQQVTNTVGEPPAHSQELLVLITTIVILAVVISLIIYIRNRKKIDNNPFLRIAVFWVGYVGAAFLAFVAPNRFLSTVRTFALNHRSSACGAG